MFCKIKETFRDDVRTCDSDYVENNNCSRFCGYFTAEMNFGSGIFVVNNLDNYRHQQYSIHSHINKDKLIFLLFKLLF